MDVFRYDFFFLSFLFADHSYDVQYVYRVIILISVSTGNYKVKKYRNAGHRIREIYPITAARSCFIVSFSDAVVVVEVFFLQ